MSAIHVNPLVSDGNWTIGYDDDGLAGQWPGNMAQTTQDSDFVRAREGAEFHDSNELYVASWDGDEIVWKDADGNFAPVRQILA